jgi:hypothetical protein
MCCENGVCTKANLKTFISSGRREMIDDTCVIVPYCAHDITTFVSPTAQQYQEEIRKATYGCDTDIDRDDKNEDKDIDGEAESKGNNLGEELDFNNEGSEMSRSKYLDPEMKEMFGKINRADLRKSCIESIDSILSSHKFPDSYAMRLWDEIAMSVSRLHQERNDEIKDIASVEQSGEFEFPCVENKKGPAEKRLKNSLG